jgi:hypothetical protein
MAAANVFVVLTNPTAGQEDEYNDWYDNVHLQEVTAIPGFVAARRYRLTGAQLEGFGDSKQRYLALYWIEGDPADAFERLGSEIAEGRIVLPECLNGADTECVNFEAFGELVRSEEAHDVREARI